MSWLHRIEARAKRGTPAMGDGTPLGVLLLRAERFSRGQVEPFADPEFDPNLDVTTEEQRNAQTSRLLAVRAAARDEAS